MTGATRANASEGTPDPAGIGLPAKPLKASASDPPAVHVRARLDAQTRALLANVNGARTGTDPEYVHQVRVSVRRMRAALKSEGASVPNVDELQTELKWLGSALGPVRDLDVLIGRLRNETEDFPPREKRAAAKLLKGLSAERRTARHRMLAALRSTRFDELLAALALAVDSAPAGDGQAPGTNGDLAGLIKKPHRKLIKDAAGLPEQPPDEDLHALRIRGKRLRYAAELAAETGGKKVAKLIDATKRFQDLLGDHQDATVAEQRVRGLLDEQPQPVDPDLIFAAGRLVEREHVRRLRVREVWRDALAEVDRRARKLLR